MDFVFDEVFLRAFRRFWARGPLCGKTNKQTTGIEDKTGEVK